MTAEVREVLREARDVILCHFPHIQLKGVHWLVPAMLGAALRLLCLLRLLGMLLQQGFPLRKVGIFQGRESQGDTLPVLLQLPFQYSCKVQSRLLLCS